jgi:hypothetical protein
MGVADQFPQLGEGADIWNLGEDHIERCQFVIDQGLINPCLLGPGLNMALHNLYGSRHRHIRDSIVAHMQSLPKCRCIIQPGFELLPPLIC